MAPETKTLLRLMAEKGWTVRHFETEDEIRIVVYNDRKRFEVNFRPSEEALQAARLGKQWAMYLANSQP